MEAQAAYYQYLLRAGNAVRHVSAASGKRNEVDSVLCLSLIIAQRLDGSVNRHLVG